MPINIKLSYPDPVPIVSQKMENSEEAEDYQKRLLEQHLSDYYKVLAVQPLRHTEEQIRLERERATIKKRSEFQLELFRLRDQYKVKRVIPYVNTA